MQLGDAELRETAELDPRLLGRWLAIAVWTCALVVVVAFGLINDAFRKLEPDYIVAGLFMGVLLGSILSIPLLLPGDSSPTGSKPTANQSVLGVGARPLISIFVAIGYVVILADGDEGLASGPIDVVASLSAAGIAIFATAFDLFFAAPRRFAGEKFDPTRVNDGGQVGLLHRGHVVACWLGPSFSILPLMLFAWFLVGVAEVNLLEGLTYGVILGAVFVAGYLAAARGSLESRIQRYERSTQRNPALKTLVIVGTSIAGFAALVALIGAIGFSAGLFSMEIALAMGLAATIVDRWYLVPRQMRPDKTDPPQSPAFGSAS